MLPLPPRCPYLRRCSSESDSRIVIINPIVIVIVNIDQIPRPRTRSITLLFSVTDLFSIDIIRFLNTLFS